MDRALRGVVGGVAGGIFMNIWNLFAFYILSMSEHRLLDWSSVYLMGKLPGSALEGSFFLLAQILWAGFLGVIFSLFVPLVESKYLLLKGMLYGFITGFIMWSLPVLFKTPVLMNMTFGTIVSHAIEGTIYGAVLAQTISWLYRNYAK